MGLNQQIGTALEQLEALYFFTQGLAGQAGRDVSGIREHHLKLPREVRRKLLAKIKSDIELLRNHYGALASNHVYRELLLQARTAKEALVYIGKLRIDRDLFAHYEKAMPRWPHIKDHAFVIFDPDLGHTNSLFEMDGQLFHDAQFVLQKARQVQGKAEHQRKLAANRHRILHSLLRNLVTTLFTFVEAYLNGIAFDCFHRHHDTLPIAEHDLLAEWDSDKKRRRFVAFDRKVFQYPVVVARAENSQIDLTGFKPAHRIVKDGKDVRDAITHPSAHYDPDVHEQRKITLLAGLTLPELESLYVDIREYVQFVEQGIGHDPKQSTPWVLDDYGFKLARDENI